MTLVLEIEYLSGVSFATSGPDSDVPEWPPQPDRIFSALVATWAARGQNQHEAEALEWLESLPPPQIIASEATLRTSAIVFVPPNDPRSDRQKNAKGVLPAMRSRQPRRFPAARPDDAIVRLRWAGIAARGEALQALQALARDTAYVGHSTSLTRCRFLLDQCAVFSAEASPADRRIYGGRFEELRRTFEAGRRPLPGARVAPAVPAARARANIFGGRWLLLEHVAGEMPDLRACAVVAKTLRDALLSGYQRLGLDIPQTISGHAADGSPSRSPHVAFVPLSFTGFPHADGHAMGFALVPPQHGGILDDDNFRKVLRELALMDDDRGRRILPLKTKQGTPSDRAFSIELSPTFEPPAGRRSLDPQLYTRSACVFGTVTPIALDRHLKEKGAARQSELASLITMACRNIGLPEPEAIVADKHSAIEGAPSAYPSGNAPPWTRWRLPPSLASRQLTHAMIRFAEPIEGPVILGAGRYLGLGLCRPLDGSAG
jgi:CRISPR-associated protein Csb2